MTNAANKQIDKKINRFKIILNSGLIGLLGYMFIGLFLPSAAAQSMSNQNYIIQSQEIDTASTTAPNDNYKPKSTTGKFSGSTSEGVNFKIEVGIDNATSTLPLSASLSSDLIDFGALTPTNPIIRTVDISVYSLSTYGYSVIAAQNHVLQQNPEASGDIIPNTTCDNGTCDGKNSAEWTNTLTYGFGYRCDNVTGVDCNSGFFRANFYKHFSNSSNSESFQSIMDGIGSKTKDIRLSYKINISGTQAQGIYSNIITYIAIPNF